MTGANLKGLPWGKAADPTLPPGTEDLISAASRQRARKSMLDWATLVCSRVGASALSLVLTACIARWLSADGYGQFALILMAGGLLASFVVNWPNNGLVRYGSEEMTATGGIRETFWSRAALLGITLAICAIAVMAFGPNLTELTATQDDQVSVLVLLVLTGLGLNGLADATLQATDRMKLAGGLQFGTKAAALLILGARYAAVGAIGIADAVLAGSVASIVGACLVLFGARAEIGAACVRPDVARRILIYATPIFLGGVGGTLARWIDLIVIRNYLSVRDVGLYSLPYQITTVVTAATLSFTTVAFPIFVAYRTSGRKDLVKAYLDGFVPIGVFLWAVTMSMIMVASELALPVIFGEAYRPSILPLQWLLVGLSFNVIGRFYSPVDSAYDLIGQTALISLFAGCLNLALDLLLVPKTGISGAAAATAISFATSHQAYIWVTNRSSFFGRRQARYAVNAFMVLPLTVLALSYVGVPPAHKAGALTLLTILTAVYARRSGYFDPRVREWLGRIELPAPARAGLNRLLNFLVPE
jgi:O-antigen/teichoic acid export membrane protein